MTNHSTASEATAPRGRRLRTPLRGRPLPVHPLLLAAYPVLFLYGQNLGELDPSDLVGPLVAIVLAALVALIVGAYLVRDARRAALVVSALAAALHWATASTEDLEIKFGILNAMYLPGSGAPELPATLSSVNTFRSIFDAYFGADLPLLPDRSFTSAGKYRPFDLTEITDRLPTAGP